MIKVITYQLAVLLCLGLVFLSLQNETVYKNTLGRIAQNWKYVTPEELVLTDTPYENLTNDKYIRWDAAHYFQIKKAGYNMESAGGDYIFAFFPLFPTLLKASSLPPVGVLFLNYFFFSAALLILLSYFSDSRNYIQNIILSLCLPSIIIFLIPYSEATFMFMASIGIAGFVKKKYWIFFVGMFLASLTRPSYTFLFLSFIGVEIFYLIQHKNFIETLKNTGLRVLPLLAGTAAVSLIQYAQGSGSLFKFIEVQKYWKNILAMPHFFKDWSHEGFAINIGVIFIIFIPLCILLILGLYNQFKKGKSFVSLNYHSSKDYLLILSSIYLVGNVLFILLYRGGSLHCLFRFSLCTPFLYILLYIGYDYLKDIALSIRFFFIGTFTLTAVLVLGLTDYSTYWNFSDFGIFVLIAAVAFWLFQDFRESRTYKIGLMLLLFTNIVWTSYLFNTYIINGWIFA